MSAKSKDSNVQDTKVIGDPQQDDRAGTDARVSPVVPRESIEEFWDDFSDEELDWIDGRVNRIYLALVQKHGMSRDEAAGELRRFCLMRTAGASCA